MGLVYYTDLLFTSGILFTPFLTAATAPWSEPQRLSSLLSLYRSIDFANYDDRQSLRGAASLAEIAPPLFTYSFDSLDLSNLIYVVAHPQRRFAPHGTFVNLLLGGYLNLFVSLASALSARDSDSDFSAQRTAYFSSLDLLENKINDHAGFYDRASFELNFVATFSVYPIPPP